MATNATVQIPDDVKTVLRGAQWGSDSVTLVGQLDRKAYEAVDKVLKAAGLKWNRSKRAHVGPATAVARLDRAVQGDDAIVDKKKALQQFFTPPELADRLVAMVPDAAFGGTVLEPSAGHGVLISAVLRKHRPQLIEAVDSDPENVSVLRQKYCGAARAAAGSTLVVVREADFLSTYDSRNVVDVVIMNPPWTRSQDIVHVMHAWSFVKPGGYLAAIVSPNSLDKETKKHKEFQRLHDDHAIIDESVPPGAFKESGTMVGALLIVWHKSMSL